MGCDIHTYVEVKRHIYDEEQWVSADYYKRNPYYDGKDEDESQYEVVHIYDDRNYGLFSILANVRNYSENKPICEPKGIPEDCCEEIKKECESWDGDGHSHSYFTLKELMDYATTHKTIKRSGMISQKQANDLDNKNIKPDSWCQWTNISDYVQREWEENFTDLDGIINSLKERLKVMLYIYGDDRIKEFSDKIRLVFWFDN